MSTDAPSSLEEQRSALAELETFLRSHELPCDARCLQRFALYLDRLVSARQRSSIVGPLSAAQMVRELICDSLQLLVLSARCCEPVVDVGSGAGFPGLPLKIVLPSLPMTLVEPRRQRHVFLEQTVQALGLENVRCSKSKIERFPLGSVGMLCSKAFTTLPRWLELGCKLLKPGGELGVLCSSSDWQQHADEARLAYELLGRVDYQWEGGQARVALRLRYVPK